MNKNDIVQAQAILGVTHGAPLPVVREAWKTLSKRYHPDNQIPGSNMHQHALEMQKEINHAYDVLKTHLSQSPQVTDKSATTNSSKSSPSRSKPDIEYETARAFEKGGDLFQAIKIFQRLSISGHSKSQFRLGYIYFDSIMKDLPQALQWWSRAAEQGHVGAQYNLGLMYEMGYGVPTDERKALHWFGQAASRGDVQAQAKLVRASSKAAQAAKDSYAVIGSVVSGQHRGA